MDIELDQDRAKASSITIFNDTVWWITGGYKNGNNPLRSTEMLEINNGEIIKNMTAPDLPKPMNGHCMARVDNNRVFMSGGSSRQSYIFNELHGNFTELPELKHQNKYGLACSTVTIKNTLMLLVVGGSSFDEPKSGKIGLMYDMTNCMDPVQVCPGNWHYNATMLSGIGSFKEGAYVNYYDYRGLVLIGGELNRIHPELDLSRQLVNYNETTESFNRFGKTMKQARQGHAAVIIRDGDIPCS